MSATVPCVVTIKTVRRYHVSAVTPDEAMEIVRNYSETGETIYLPADEPTIEWSAECENDA